MQDAAVIPGVTGSAASIVGFDDESWYDVSVPCTVMGGLLENGVYEDPFFGLNLQNIPKFNLSTWYRTEFETTQDMYGHTITLLFKGLNYRANVWFNGVKIGDYQDIVGTFRWFKFDITSLAIVPGMNALAAEIFMPYDVSVGIHNSTDLAISFVDWSPEPPDANMGLWQEVMLEHIPGYVSISYPQVATELSTDALGTTVASVTVLLELHNYATKQISGLVKLAFPRAGTLTQSVTVNAQSDLQVNFTYKAYPSLVISNPDLWWPWQMGDPVMQELTATFSVGNMVHDTITSKFGLRQVTSELDSKNSRLFKVNGKSLLIRGGGFTPDLFQRVSAERQEVEMKYMRDLYQNTIRLEGKFENEHFFDLADQYGMLVMLGWCCCDSWQHWSLWSEEEHFVAMESTRSQVKRLRIHPSVFVFLYGSDEAPPLDTEKEFLQVFEEEQWVLPTLASAAATKSSITGPTGVKMTGPYSWVPPNYWSLDTGILGGAWGFLTEGGPGEAPLTYESLVRTLPPDHLWPIDSWWEYHTSTGTIDDFRFFTPALDARYGTSKDAIDFSYTSQIANYEGLRAMFEAYSQNRYSSTGLIQWMQNNPWTSFKWHFYDYFLVQGGGYFGSKKGCEPLHIMYSYAEQRVYVINNMFKDYTQKLQGSIDALYFNGTVFWERDISLPSVAVDSVVALTNEVVPTPVGYSGTYFIRLLLKVVSTGEVISDNFYWLSTQPDVLDWAQSTWYRTPCSQYADLTQLRTLNKVELSYSATTQTNGTEATTLVTISNPTKDVAFFLRCRLQCSGEDIVPSIWSDNFITLLSGESRVLTVAYKTSQLQNCGTPTVMVESFNNNAK